MYMGGGGSVWFLIQLVVMVQLRYMYTGRLRGTGWDAQRVGGENTSTSPQYVVHTNTTYLGRPVTMILCPSPEIS